MRRGVLAGFGLALMWVGVAQPAAAEDWRACVVGACLNAGGCGDNGASVLVSMATNIDDPAIGGETQATTGLLDFLNRRGGQVNQPMMKCSPPQPSEEAARQMSMNIFAQMSTSFADTTLVSPNDVYPGYDSVPGSEDPRYNGGDSGAGSDDGAVVQEQDQAAAQQRQAEADAQAQAQRERETAAEAAAQAEREREAAAAEAERERVAEQEREQRERAEANAKMQASTNTDATRCVSQPELRANDTYQGNTAAYVSNGCGTPVDVRICLMRDNGWNCGMTNGLAPQASWSWSSFRATGQVFMDARVSGSGRTLNSP